MPSFLKSLRLGKHRSAANTTPTQPTVSDESSLFIAGPIVIFKWKVEDGWPVEYVSPNILSQFGYSPEEITSKIIKYRDLIHPDDLGRVAEEVDAFTNSPVNCYEQEYRIRCKNGQYRWVYDFTIAIKDTKRGEISHRGYIFDITDRKRAEKIRTAIYSISQAANAAVNLEDLYRSIHNILGELMPVGNFFIAVLDPESELLSFPYFVDEYDTPPSPKRLGRGLTEFVLRTGLPLLASPEKFQQLVEAGEVESIGTPSLDWLGVPLKFKEKTLGLMAVQTYKEGVRFGEEELSILTFVSTQVGMAIERKQAEEGLKESEKAHRTLVENIPIGIYRNTPGPKGQFIMTNPAFRAMFGFESEEQVKTITVADLYANPGERQEFSEKLLSEGSIKGMELRLKKRDGTILWGSITARVENSNGNEDAVFFDCTIEDITEHKEAELVVLSLTTKLRNTAFLARKISSILDPNKLIQEAVEAVFQVIQCYSATIFLLEGNNLILTAGQGEYVDKTPPLNHHIPLGIGVVGTVAQTGQPLLVADTAKDPHYLAYEYLPLTRSELAVPVKRSDRLLGVIDIQAAEVNAFDSTDLETMNILADQLAVSLENALLFDQVQRHLQQTRALREVDTTITASVDLNTTLKVILEKVYSLLHVDAADILLLNPFSQTLEFAAEIGFHTQALRYTHLRLGEGYAGRAAYENRTIHITNLPDAMDSLERSPHLVTENFVEYYAKPLVSKGQVKAVLEIFHRAHLKTSQEWLDFFETLAEQAVIAIDNAQLFNSLQRANIELSQAYDATIEGWSSALEMRDKETEGHTRRVTEMTVRLARCIGMKDEQLVHLRRGALLHDIGKMGIPDNILLKQGPLTEEEWKIMRKHADYAYELLSPIDFLRPALEIPYCHHEKWDGSGYPRGLKGEQIPLGARIFAIVDVWDALSSNRPYQNAWETPTLLNYIREQNGKHFDPQVVEAFFTILQESEKILQS